MLPQFVKDVAKQLHISKHGSKGEGSQIGRYTLTAAR